MIHKYFPAVCWMLLDFLSLGFLCSALWMHLQWQSWRKIGHMVDLGSSFYCLYLFICFVLSPCMDHTWLFFGCLLVLLLESRPFPLIRVCQSWGLICFFQVFLIDLLIGDLAISKVLSFHWVKPLWLLLYGHRISYILSCSGVTVILVSLFLVSW